MTTTTEEPQQLAPDARPERSGFSVRTRTTATVAVLVALALTSAGLIVYLIEAQRLEEQVADHIDQEFSELELLSTTGVDPETGTRFADVQSILDTFLVRNVPEENETLVSWYDGRLQQAYPSAELARTSEFVDAAGPLVQQNGTTRITIGGREHLLSAQALRFGEAGDEGSLIVVVDLDSSSSGLRSTMRTYAIVALLSLLVITVLAGWQSGRLLAPLRTLRETAEEISDTDLSRRLPVTGNDDITALTRTFNGMLDRLEAAFVGQRRFLDDAGHELRTPLTVLRGHLELLDAGSPEEVAETKALLLDETDRMARLVGDLILLAKSDRPDFVRPAPVDLTELTVDVLAKARGLGDRVWALDGTARVTVPVDEQRLTQALLQLCDNAVKHTAPGQIVAVGSSYDATTARLWVRDSGPGVPSEDRDRIFVRFGRGPAPHGDEGFGLGLSIVQAIAEAHGGTVHVEDADPPGARFVISLPLAGPPEADDTLEDDFLDEDDEQDEETQPIRAEVPKEHEGLSLWPRS